MTPVVELLLTSTPVFEPPLTRNEFWLTVADTVPVPIDVDARRRRTSVFVKLLLLVAITLTVAPVPPTVVRDIDVVAAWPRPGCCRRRCTHTSSTVSTCA